MLKPQTLCRTPTEASTMGPWHTGFGHAGRVFGLAFHPHNSAIVASASEDETVRVWQRSEAPGAGWQQVGRRF
jgi:WD40 repeat protein